MKKEIVRVGVERPNPNLSAGIRVGPSGHASVDVGFFYDDLATYGNWVERPNYGWAWRPHSRSILRTNRGR